MMGQGPEQEVVAVARGSQRRRLAVAVVAAVPRLVEPGAGKQACWRNHL